eukprot:gnl/MRDRNA2_/MRDRNA2_217287_c0_seq1.p1 gnl/MRDRNA2_/MRDRNA2_217287_c0~~gnl/MRDRNA2_/MRDRNA2_217287_c0_seq1.p1  ORF type:complete len:187 (+),score=33.72 gnl/MRDRNA2_/MRDRNA2_217287_c0_seq1:29-562(+)
MDGYGRLYNMATSMDPGNDIKSPPPPAGLQLTKQCRGANVYELLVKAGDSWRDVLPYPKMLLVIKQGAAVKGTFGDRMLLPADVFRSNGPMQLSLQVSGKSDVALWVIELLGSSCNFSIPNHQMQIESFTTGPFNDHIECISLGVLVLGFLFAVMQLKKFCGFLKLAQVLENPLVHT